MADRDKDILDIVEEPGPDISEEHLFRTIWLHPRHTYRFIFKNCPEKYVWGLLIVGGVAGSLGNSTEYSGLTGVTGFLLLVLSVAIGGILGPVANLIFAALLRRTAIWLNGTADYSKVLTVLAWSLVPTVAGVVFFLARWLYFGNDIFQGNTDLSTSLSDIIYTVISAGETILWIWSLVIMVIGLSEANGFGIGRAIANVLLASFVIFLFAFFLAILIGIF